jgi:hypothetical protein
VSDFTTYLANDRRIIMVSVAGIIATTINTPLVTKATMPWKGVLSLVKKFARKKE